MTYYAFAAAVGVVALIGAAVAGAALAYLVLTAFDWIARSDW